MSKMPWRDWAKILNITTGKSGTDFNGGNSQPAQRIQMSNRDQHGSGAEGGRYRGGGRLTLLSPLLAGLVLSAGLSLGPLSAQTNVVRTAPSSDRCLIIVETSKSMQRRADAVVGAVRGCRRPGWAGPAKAAERPG